MTGARLDLERIKLYVDRAGALRANADAAISGGELDKAGEFLWGVMACYLNALKLMYTGKTAGTHKELMEVAIMVAKELGDERFRRAIKNAERLHANFYHLFLDAEDFARIYDDILYAARQLHELLLRGEAPPHPR